MKISSGISLSHSAAIAALTLALTACGGGSSGSDPPASAPPAAANTAPKIADLAASESIAQDGSGAPLAFTVSDAEASASNVTVTVASSDPTLISPDAILLAGNDAARTLLVTPTEGMAGTSTVTITATDAEGLSTQQSVAVTVTSEERSFKEMVDTAFATGVETEGERTIGYQWVDAAEDEETAFDHLFRE